MEKLFECLRNILKLPCSHTDTVSKNCRYCPDCGKKLTSKWIIVRCKSCDHYREPIQNWTGKIVPRKKFCFYCGSGKWELQNYYKSTIPDSFKSIAMLYNEAEEEYKFGRLTQKTKVWISLPDN